MDVPGRIISDIGVISQLEAHCASTPVIEFEPRRSGCRATRLLLLRSWRMVPTGLCLKEPVMAPRPPAEENCWCAWVVSNVFGCSPDRIPYNYLLMCNCDYLVLRDIMLINLKYKNFVYRRWSFFVRSNCGAETYI